MTTRVDVEMVAGVERVVARFPYSEQAVARVKSISGARWNREGRFWDFPMDLTACQMLRKAFPDLTIGPDLWKWAKAEQGKRTELGDLHVAKSAEPVDLPIVRENYPTMWAAMQARGYQTLVPAFAKSVGSYFNASQPGAGKTIETLATLAELEKAGNILVVAPKKAIQSTWPREIARWMSPDASTSVMVCDAEQGSMTERDALLAEFAAEPGDAEFRFVLIHPEMLSWKFICGYVKPSGVKCNGKAKTCPNRSNHAKVANYPSLFTIKWDAVIMDETHKMMMNANEKSGNVSGWGYGAQKLQAKSDALKIGMSGTPFKGKPRRFWPMLHWLAPQRYTGQYKWAKTYFETERDMWAASGEKLTDRMREDRRDVFEADLASIMIRHTKRELRKVNPAWAPPEKIHVDVRVKMDPKQAKAYTGMVTDASARLANGELTADGILAERTRLKQFANAYGKLDAAGSYAPALPSGKWDWIVDALEERGLAKGMNDGEVKIVIASQFVSLLKMMSREFDALGINHLTIYGETRNVKAVEDKWQSDQTDARVLLLSTQAGGVSLTLDAADDVFVVDEPENPDDGEQLEDRVHRTSRTDHQVTIYHIASEGTIDESIASGNLSMDITQKALLDGRRGVEFARLTLEGGKA